MPYRIDQFREMGLYEERAAARECSFEGGTVIRDVSSKIRSLLETVGGSSHKGDASRQDSAVITSMLVSGMAPPDVYATFVISPRGRHAEERKEHHFDDYVRRTIEKAVGFLSEANGSNKVEINFSSARVKNQNRGLVISMGHEVETEKTQWIWPGYIPAGKLTLVAGDPGMGKSTMVGDIISRITRGTYLPSGQRTVTGTCLVASAEDSPEDTIIPRLIACDANLKRVGVIREVKEEGDTDKDESRYLSFPRDLSLLRETLISRGIRLLIIDPLTAFLEKGTDSYKDQDMRRILHPMEAMAEETGTAILIVAHLNKREDSSTLYRVGGSIGFIGAARSVLAVTRLPDSTRVLYSLKSNLSVRPPSMAYEVKQVQKTRTERNTWLGVNTITSSAIRWLGEVDFDPFSKNAGITPESRTSEEAEDFLRQLLGPGEEDTDTIYREARNTGITRPVLNRAKSALKCVQNRREGKWYWGLPSE